MKVRHYKNKDRNQVISLWKTVFFDAPPWAEASVLLDKKLSVDDLIFVAEDNGKLIGTSMAGYDGHSGWIYSVAVDPQHRRMSIGKQLVVYATQVLNDLGSIKVGLQVGTENSGAIEFYKSIGFEIEDRVNLSKFIDL